MFIIIRPVYGAFRQSFCDFPAAAAVHFHLPSAMTVAASIRSTTKSGHILDELNTPK